MFKGEVPITLRLMEDVNIPGTVASITSSLTPSAWTFSASSQGTHSFRLWPDDKTGSEERSAVPAIPLVGSSSFGEPLSRRHLTVLLLKDNTGYVAADYWLDGTQLHCSTLDGEHKLVPLGETGLK
jgi:hypothetical protein